MVNQKYNLTFGTMSHHPLSESYYFSSEQASYLNFQVWIDLYQRPKQMQSGTLSSNVEYESYFVVAPPNWTSRYADVDHITSTVSIITNIQSRSQLMDDTSIHKVVPIHDPKYFNRYTTGFLQGNECDIDFFHTHMISKRSMNSIGYNGTGQIIVIADSGINTEHPLFQDKILYVPGQSRTGDKEGHGTHCAGIAAGYTDKPIREALYAGHAQGAKLIDINSKYMVSSKALQAMYNMGAALFSNSWGLGADVTRDDNEYYRWYFDNLANVLDQHFVLIFAVGNDGAKGHFTASSPADGRNILAVGATSYPPLASVESKRDWFVDDQKARVSNDPFFTSPLVNLSDDQEVIVSEWYQETTKPLFVVDEKRDYEHIYPWPQTMKSTKRGRMSFSSHGPSFLGLIKPDIMAPGYKINSAQNAKEGIVQLSGTSMACPAIAGEAAVLRQFFLDQGITPRSTLIRAALINSADAFDNSSIAGEPHLTRLLQNTLFYQGSIEKMSHVKFLLTANETTNISITLSWNEPVTEQPENDRRTTWADLDVYLYADSHVYTGNGQTPCVTSTNEKIMLNDAPPGEYEVHILAPYQISVTTKYALVVTGSFQEESLDPEKVTQIDCEHGTNAGGICKCDDGYHGSFCSQQFEPMYADSPIEMTMYPGEVRYFYANFSGDAILGIFGMRSSCLVYAGFSFSKVTDEETYFSANEGDFQAIIGGSERFYFALYGSVAPTGSAVTFKLTSIDPEPETEATEIELSQTETSDVEISEIETADISETEIETTDISEIETVVSEISESDTHQTEAETHSIASETPAISETSSEPSVAPLPTIDPTTETQPWTTTPAPEKNGLSGRDIIVITAVMIGLAVVICVSAAVYIVVCRNRRTLEFEDVDPTELNPREDPAEAIIL